MMWNSIALVPLGPGTPGFTGTANGATVLAHTTLSTNDGAKGSGRIFRKDSRATRWRVSAMRMNSRVSASGSSRSAASCARTAAATTGAVWAAISTCTR